MPTRGAACEQHSAAHFSQPGRPRGSGSITGRHNWHAPVFDTMPNSADNYAPAPWLSETESCTSASASVKVACNPRYVPSSTIMRLVERGEPRATT